MFLPAKIAEVIVARLEPEEDLFKGIQRICREANVKTGVVLSITGALKRARLEKFPATYADGVEVPHTELVDIEGPLEASGHGIIGEVYAPDLGDKPFGVGRYVHGEPYMHVHMVVTSAKETICGHLVEGCPIRSINPVSHFTIMIGRLDGVSLRLAMDVEQEKTKGFDHGIYHDLRAT